MEGHPHRLFTATQITAVARLWLVVAWKTPWNAQRYLGTVLVVLGIGFSHMLAINSAIRF